MTTLLTGLSPQRAEYSEQAITLSGRREFNEAMRELCTSCDVFLATNESGTVVPREVFGKAVGRAAHAVLATPIHPRPGEQELKNLRNHITALDSLLDARDGVALALSKAHDAISLAGNAAIQQIDSGMRVVAGKILEQCRREGLISS